MDMLKKLVMLSLVLSSVTFMSACNDNSAEEAGEKIDEVVTDAGNAVEDACEEVKESAGAKDSDC
jgi:predicted small secreted protein